ncbi:MAG: hypothetical protein EAZ98_05790 [Oscillatoriales cyanobacterium]|uniref:Uncharacterized protein n=1 Tax=Microcoleus anatoxicus PTRS2 TaxID=2705321 RepID=A0ABU8YJ66_9CYAN|nr:MAG: hypothetical protein EA000_09505 [Oscillatoriales cyanobacterium]TAD98738.1 MAG: hypothetical protein EAZ98_05790 [Oscillatoriales cyanobacterium]
MTSTTNHFQTAKSFYKKEKWDLDSWFQVTQTDYKKLMEQYPFEEMLASFENSQINLIKKLINTSFPWWLICW